MCHCGREEALWVESMKLGSTYGEKGCDGVDGSHGSMHHAVSKTMHHAEEEAMQERERERNKNQYKVCTLLDYREADIHIFNAHIHVHII